MKEVNENIKDTELNLDDLSEVNGGMLRSAMPASTDSALASTGSVVAYCKKCGKKLKDLGPRRIMGGTTNIFICTNTKCKEYNKKKNNLQVRFP